jgi:hypothetical protein
MGLMRRLFPDRSPDRAAHNLWRIAEARVKSPGLHELRVRGPNREEPLVVTVGTEWDVGDAMLDVVPGRNLFHRLRGED